MKRFGLVARSMLEGTGAAICSRAVSSERTIACARSAIGTKRLTLVSGEEDSKDRQPATRRQLPGFRGRWPAAIRAMIIRYSCQVFARQALVSPGVSGATLHDQAM